MPLAFACSRNSLTVGDLAPDDFAACVVPDGLALGAAVFGVDVWLPPSSASLS